MLNYRNHSSGRALGFHGRAGFTLLEVLISIAILATVLTAVLRLEKQSIDMGGIQKEVVVASILANNLMSEMELQDFPAVGNTNGDFGEDFPQYIWSREVAETFFEGVNEVKLTVQRRIGNREPQSILTVTKYFVEPGTSVKLRSDFDLGEAEGLAGLEDFGL